MTGLIIFAALCAAILAVAIGSALRSIDDIRKGEDDPPYYDPWTED
jgi:hypothetical protein